MTATATVTATEILIEGEIARAMIEMTAGTKTPIAPVRGTAPEPDTVHETLTTIETIVAEVAIGSIEAGEMNPVTEGGEDGATLLTPSALIDGMIAENRFQIRLQA